MKKLIIEIKEEVESISFNMPNNDFSKSEVIGFLSQFIHQLNDQLLTAAKKEAKRK